MSQIFSKILSYEYSIQHKMIMLGSLWSIMVWSANLMFRERSSRETREIAITIKDGGKKKKEKILVPHELLEILKKISGPKEYGFFALATMFLITKTVTELIYIEIGTKAESAIVCLDMAGTIKNLLAFIISTPSLSYVSNSLKFCLTQLKLRIRHNLSVLLTKRYMDNLTYYRLSALDSSCQNVDQLLTNDIEKFSSSLVDFYSNAAKPILDIIIVVQRLVSSYTGFQAPIVLLIYFLFSAAIVSRLRKPITAMTIKETKLEGQLRYIHSRLIANCEEVAFYQGHERETIVLLNALLDLKEHSHRSSRTRFTLDYVENFITKYLATVVGVLSLSFSVFSVHKDKQLSERLNIYYTSGKMFFKIAESIGRLIVATKEMAKLSAYTHRISHLIKSIENIPNQDTKGITKICDPDYPLIQLSEVPLCTPKGETLVTSLNVTIKAGDNVIITGPNGSGKSSLFRTIGQLWPLHGGRLVKPPNKELFYIPQKPYLAIGTFRDQLIYPDTIKQMKEKHLTDEELRVILDKVELGYLLDRENWDSIKDWQEVLSGGEKQRMAIGRLIYHKPLFAILDECTSAVSVDVEQKIYDYLTNSLNCTLLSVSHRVKQLQHFHKFVLKFDGCGGYSYQPLDQDDV